VTEKPLTSNKQRVELIHWRKTLNCFMQIKIKALGRRKKLL